MSKIKIYCQHKKNQYQCKECGGSACCEHGKRKTYCKECVNLTQAEMRKTDEYKKYRKEYDANRLINDREKELKRRKDSYIKNRDSILEKKCEYRAKPENREHAKEYASKYQKENKETYYSYRKKNPHIIAWRAIVYRTLSYLGKMKQGHTIDELGYSAIELREHIENQFTEGISWNNHGEWEIDHIKPLTKFDQSASVSEVNALSNLQPLWKLDNIRKYNHYKGE